MYAGSIALWNEATGSPCGPLQTALCIPFAPAVLAKEGVYARFVAGGDVHIVHIRHVGTAEGGSLVTIDASASASIQARHKSPYDILTLEIPAARLASLPRTTEAASNLQVIREPSSSPLAACMTYLAQHVRAASRHTVAALYEACVSLLVAEASRLETVMEPSAKASANKPLLRAMLAFTDRNISDPSLAPAAVATKFGISVRYLHKVFAASGVTFGAYVLKRRLDHVHNALISGSGATRTIAELAHEWGFRDISGFNRAFRKHFGCPPRTLRTRAAT